MYADKVNILLLADKNTLKTVHVLYDLLLLHTLPVHEVQLCSMAPEKEFHLEF